MRSKHPLRAFTLFELLLAIALSATLLILLGTAINLYLVRTEAGRTQVEQAQLARSVLAMIANDIRATAQYQTQDISSVAQLALAAKSFDVDSIDAAAKASGITSTAGASGGGGQSGGGGRGGGGNPGGGGKGGGDGGGGGGSTSNSFGSGTVHKAGSGGTKKTASGGSSQGSSSTSSNSSDSSSTNQDTTTSSVPGVNGTLEELILDVSRLPRNEELYPNGPRPADTTTTNASQGARPSDAKSVRYFVREGNAIDPSDIAATSLSPQEQMQVGGLVRQAIDRQVRTSAEQTGDQAMLEEGQVLVAPEVVGVEFRYFDGSASGEEWNMQELTTLPRAIEVRIWLADLSDPEAAHSTTTQLLSSATMYSETVELPLVDAAGVATSSTQSGSDSQSGSSTSGTSSGSGLGTSGSSGTESQR